MTELYKTLLELQSIDRQIEQAEADLKKFDPQIEEVESPLKALEQEIGTSRSRLTEMRAQSNKLETGATNKREKLDSYKGRLDRIRNQREEAAIRTEMDLVRSALEADENEALEMMEQVRRTDLRLDELEKQVVKMRAEVEPKKEGLLQARADAEQQITVLKHQRSDHAARIDQNAIRLYERVRSGKRKTALAPLGPDGSCGNCFNILPLQEQSEVRRGTSLHRCEACGIILFPPEEAE